MDDAEEKQVCRMFRNSKPNYCRFGEECKYEHSVGEPIAVPKRDPEKPRDECFNWRDNHECKFDVRCRFLHGEADDRFDVAGKRKGTGRKKRRPKDNGDAAAAPGNNANNQDNQGQPKAERRPRRRKPKIRQVDGDGKEVCRNFVKNNQECRWGEECKFSHGPAVGPAPDDKPEAAAAAPKERRPRLKKPKTPGLCFSFRDSGECEWGDGCRFKHGEEDAREIPQKKAGPCYRFRDGNCEYGEKCRFSHEQEAPEASL